MEKAVLFAKAKTLPIGSVRKHGGSLYRKTVKGWMRVKKKGHIAKDKFVVKKKSQVNDIYTRILERQKKMDKKYAPLKGMRVKTPDGQEWEFQQTNDLGIPYFSIVKKNIVQKKQFTIAHLYSKEWADKTLFELQKKPITVKKEKVEIKKNEPAILKRKDGREARVTTSIYHTGMGGVNVTYTGGGKGRVIKKVGERVDTKETNKLQLEIIKKLKTKGFGKLQTTKKPIKNIRQAQKARVKSGVKPGKVKQPMKKKSIVKKKTTLRTVTEQYQDKIKQLSIMNKPGRLIYKKMIQQAIKDKDKEQLKLIFKDIDSWLFRNKQFKKKKNIRKKR